MDGWMNERAKAVVSGDSQSRLVRGRSLVGGEGYRAISGFVSASGTRRSSKTQGR